MTAAREVSAGRCFAGRISGGEDLLAAFQDFCRSRGVSFARLEAIGTVRKARLGYFEQGSKQYQWLELDQPLEITNLTGNVSIRDGQPMVHAHLTLSDQEGRAFGGHLGPGTVVFACEFFLQEFLGEPLRREQDAATGLALWRL